MIVSIIVAVAENNVIGKDNDLIWHLPMDMKYFKEKTIGHHIITGRKNYVSIPEKFRPLNQRTNIVLTRQSQFNEDGVILANSLEEAIAIANKNGENEVFVIGGGQIYKECMEKDLADKLYITKVHHSFDGDTWFPEVDYSKWTLISEDTHQADEKNKYAFTFTIYQKK